jgi:hypothetical protein
MDTTLLNVPYVSQKAPGAELHNNDCGAACMSMMLKAFNLANNSSVDELFNLIEPVGNIGLSALAMAAEIKELGLNVSWINFPSQAALFEALQRVKPVIALIHYEPFVKNGFSEFKNFLGAHYVVLIGMDIANVYLHDPDRDDGVTVTAVPTEVFWEAWEQCPLDDGNPAFMGIVPDLPILDLAPGRHPAGAGRYVLIAAGANVHTKPDIDSPFFAPAVMQNPPNVIMVTITEVVNGYGHLQEGGWVSMDLFKPADT